MAVRVVQPVLENLSLPVLGWLLGVQGLGERGPLEGRVGLLAGGRRHCGLRGVVQRTGHAGGAVGRVRQPRRKRQQGWTD